MWSVQMIFLPVPVAAQATISFPIKAIGMHAAWMGVGCTKLQVVTAFSKGRDKFISWNVIAADVESTAVASSKNLSDF